MQINIRNHFYLIYYVLRFLCKIRHAMFNEYDAASLLQISPLVSSVVEGDARVPSS